MLLNDLYTIPSLAGSDNQIRADIFLNAAHPIFTGHFPGQPVLPGVCMMEMIAEIIGEHHHKLFRVSAAPLIKFLHMIDPRKDPAVQLEIKYQQGTEGLQCTGKIFREASVFMKFQMVLNEAG